ncbi:MAG: membrane-bound ClpP family serine protease [Rhodothermales bacterium]
MPHINWCNNDRLARRLPHSLLEILIPIALITLGLALIAAEVYLVPGINVFGIVGLVLIVFAVGYVFTESGPLGGFITLVGASAGCGAMYWAMWKSGAWERFVLSTTLKQGSGGPPGESEQRSSYLGKKGLALTPLRPTGVVEIESDRIEVVTEGSFIAAGSWVRVVAMDRRRFFVRLADDMAEDPAQG